MPEGIGNYSQWMGMNSGIDPESLPSNVMWQTMNTISRGGIVRTRPGFESVYNGPYGWPQGCTFFTTSDNKHYFVFAVNGYVYASEYPFRSYFALSGIRFSPLSLHVTFEVCQQTTTYDPDGNFEFLSAPLNVLIMQDGRTKAAYWDGSASRHLNPVKSTGEFTEDGKDETPMGLWMSWANDRLWVFRDNLGFASDIGNPLKFTETQYLSEARAFLFPGTVTGAVQPYARSPLIVFTNDTLTQLQAQIRDRTTWAETPNFQTTEYNLGCVSGKSIVKSFGETWWFSQFGVVNLNYALQFEQSSKFQYMDNQMAISKAYLSPTINRVCAASYENYVLFSVPSGHIYNRHTWVLDQMNTPQGSMAWDSYWTGIRPVQWAVTVIEGRQRAFALSYDADKVTRIWEAFSPERNDNGCSITCIAETGRYNDSSKLLKKYKHSRIFLDGLEGDSYLSIKVASEHGPYNEILNRKFVATKGSIDDGYTNNIIDFLPQNRRFNTGYLIIDSEDCNACGVEVDEPHDIGTCFSHLFTWSGEIGIAGFQMLLEEVATPQDFESDCRDDEVGPKIITAAGCESVDRNSLPDGYILYESTQEATDICPVDSSITGYAIATRTSIISQSDTDARALCSAGTEANASMYLCNDGLGGQDNDGDGEIDVPGDWGDTPTPQPDFTVETLAATGWTRTVGWARFGATFRDQSDFNNSSIAPPFYKRARISSSADPMDAGGDFIIEGTSIPGGNYTYMNFASPGEALWGDTNKSNTQADSGFGFTSPWSNGADIFSSQTPFAAVDVATQQMKSIQDTNVAPFSLASLSLDGYTRDVLGSLPKPPNYRNAAWQALPVSKQVGELLYHTAFSTTVVTTAPTDLIWFHLYDEQTWYAALMAAEGMGYPAVVETTDDDCYVLTHYLAFNSRLSGGNFIPGHGFENYYLHMNARGLNVRVSVSNMVAGQNYKVTYTFDQYDISGGLPGSFVETYSDEFIFTSPIDGAFVLDYSGIYPSVGDRMVLQDVTMFKSDNAANTNVFDQGANYSITP